MKEDHPDHRPVLSRRDFLKLAGTATIGAALAGCRSASPVPTPAAVATGTVATAVAAMYRPEILRFYPDAPESKVVRIHHAGAWDGSELVSPVLSQMLDASITELTGLGDALEAWKALFRPQDRIAIKVSTIATSDFFTHVPLVMAVAERLQAAGVPVEQITIYDRSADELKRAGFEINSAGPGVRCEATDGRYTQGFKVMDTSVGLSDILLNSDALINIPLLKHHNHSGVTFALKNHFGSFDSPSSFHRPKTGDALLDLNALPAIRDRTRLVIGDLLQVCPIDQHGWFLTKKGDSVLMSFDPIAHDAVGLEILRQMIVAKGYDMETTQRLADTWLPQGEARGLGTSDPVYIKTIEKNLV